MHFEIQNLQLFCAFENSNWSQYDDIIFLKFHANQKSQAGSDEPLYRSDKKLETYSFAGAYRQNN